ncbi:MAG: universal stress protein [Chloroflexi bacterium]|nr:universal stress protein [Chloroflexota bacterium]
MSYAGKSLTRILVPLDGSRLAESTLPVVSALAACTGAEILLLHIIEEHPPHTVHGEPHLASVPDAQDYLARLSERIAPGSNLEKHVHATEEHDVALSIASHADELGASIIALCAHGRGGPKRLVFGSIAQQVLRRVTVPVLLVPDRSAENPALDLLLVPLDGTISAEAALPIASEIASSCASQLYLVKVVPTISTVTGDRAASARLTPISTAATLDTEALQAQNYLRFLSETLSSQHITVGATVRRGETIPSLVATAQQVKAGIIVLATHGRAGLGTFWIGSVAAGLAGKVSQPLLLLRIPAER